MSRSGKFGSTILRFDTLESTNDYARNLAASGEDEGTVVIARRQTRGRGQHGRSWISPAGHGLYFSVILRPQVRAEGFGVLTLGAAVAVAESIAAFVHLKPDIKWPNDVLISGKKVCGILVESAIESGIVRYAILGIGVNVGQTIFPEEIAGTATSLTIESGVETRTEDFLPGLLDSLELWYRRSLNEPAGVLARWQELSSYARGCAVRVFGPDGEIEGVTEGLTDQGALIVRTITGERREIFSGEVSLRKL